MLKIFKARIELRKLALEWKKWCKRIAKAAKEILGSCVSMGVTVEGKDPREVQREIDEGKYDEIFEKEEAS